MRKAILAATLLAGCTSNAAPLTPWQAYLVRHGVDPNGVTAAETEAHKSGHCHASVYHGTYYSHVDAWCD